MTATQTSVKHLITDLKAVAHDSEELLKASTSDVKEVGSELRNRLTRSLASARASCQRLQEATVKQAMKADKVVHTHPYATAGVALGAGMLLGLLAGRCCSKR
jgi:ElaB/YqjD/DUF883 family membrane-anchored ribosome-binding protein